jgi:hypothetical protein
LEFAGAFVDSKGLALGGLTKEKRSFATLLT